MKVVKKVHTFMALLNITVTAIKINCKNKTVNINKNIFIMLRF
jgi:hypothetical protein